MSITLRTKYRISPRKSSTMLWLVSDPEDLAAYHSQEMGRLPQQLHPGT